MNQPSPFDLARFFQALGNDVRLRLLSLIGEREICVCHLVDALGLPQPLISQHLACLRSAGIVEARREGKWMHYRIVMPQHESAARILKEVLISLCDGSAPDCGQTGVAQSCCGGTSSI